MQLLSINCQNVLPISKTYNHSSHPFLDNDFANAQTMSHMRQLPKSKSFGIADLWADLIGDIQTIG